MDKVLDRKGNLDWLTGHFAQTPFKNSVPLMLSTVTLVELSAGVCSLVGAVGAVFEPLRAFMTVGTGLACLALLMLFFGQRIAKDYPGAASLATYFVVALVSLFLVGHQPR